MQIVLISGLSGSGKSVALNVLEDAGYYVVDNLPATLLPQLVTNLRGAGYRRVAVAVDVRSGMSIAALPGEVERLRGMIADVRFIFLDARDDTLIARFSETRRRHPLAEDNVTLAEAIAREREALDPIARLGYRMDTSDTQANTLRAWIKDYMQLEATDGLTLLFQSFGFKYGIPVDADLVFDVRCLPNPHYDPKLRPLTGKDQPVIDFLERIPEVGRMAEDIRVFVANWLPAYIRDNRSYLTVAIGCTGGQHRSVYFAEWLAKAFGDNVRVMVRHRASARRSRDGQSAS
ncbi:RNase adapter RapZ [Denitromonas ohlonensis]|uniref:RNase adapter RapZ n=2 Tax=Denitromonas TaxID=139331 RepID=A0A558CEV9_9RHOO|nr:RNase adapter RapZ [Denitromonas ohlonensis]TVO67863.1 RNase adapter RapZ [Denitromonas ohlonensis]TVO78232.1 RNase adapter RapZ [Denitromonas ohlonensis]TVT47301.1 MAG: RNase adapter RapZ [Denitromonas halophila]TVT71653.1 MAG: RNase adapter RapZ [Denitromonas halophila]